MNVYNTNGEQFDLVYEYPTISRLMPGESVCFAFSYLYPEYYSHFTLETGYISGASKPKISILSTESSVTDWGDIGLLRQTVSGTIKNDDVLRVSSLRSVITFYDIDGKVYDCMDTIYDSNYSAISDYIDPGFTGFFRFLYHTTKSKTEYDPYSQNYKVIIDGSLP
jgi:hypothetical protein